MQGSVSLHSRGQGKKETPPSLLSFSSFVSTFGRSYRPGSAEYEERKAVFEKRKAEAENHNRKPNRIWTAGVNRLSDWTDAELQKLYGYTGLGRSQAAKTGHGAVAFLSSAHEMGRTSLGTNMNKSMSLADIPTSKSWAHLKALHHHRDQGACGSCWAIAAARLIEAHAEILGGAGPKSFSTQELLSCTPNPKHCGGEGGCDGATFDLALDYAYAQGALATDEDWPYKPEAQSSRCPASSSSLVALKHAKHTARHVAKHLAKQDGSGDQGEDGGEDEDEEKEARVGAARFGSYSMLPSNTYAPVLRALYETGPVGVSVAADPWQGYSSGIFDGCDGDREGAIVNHAVVLVAYGEEDGLKYWKLMNSWGQDWGENGHIRLLRREDDEKRCRTDTKPEVGSSCEPYPDSVSVCGQCGILYEPVALRGGEKANIEV